MSCHICGRGSCASWMHSLEEQERYAPAIELFEKAEELREKIRNEEAEEELKELEEALRQIPPPWPGLNWMHSLEEQERYAPAIELFEKAEELREKIRNEETEERTDAEH